MKSYREIADSVFARRDEYVIAQRKKKQAVTRVTASVGSVALVSLAGIALFKNDAFHETPPVAPPTTATHFPVTEGTPTTTTPTPSASASSEVTDPTVTTTAPSKTQTTADKTDPTESKTDPPTTAKTQPSQTTATTTAPKKTVIGATKPDNDFLNQSAVSKKAKYISRLLRQMMEAYEGYDVVFAVHVKLPVTEEDIYEDFWGSSEELSQFYKEYYDVHNAFYDEAKYLNPSWDGHKAEEIEVWTDTMRANYEYWLTLVDKMKQLEEQDRKTYIQSVLNQRFEMLKAVSGTEPIDVDVECNATPSRPVVEHTYYVELTHEQIDILAEYGGYIFTLGQNDHVAGQLNQ